MDSKKGEGGRIVFASAPASFLRIYIVAPKLEPVVALGRSPFLLQHKKGGMSQMRFNRLRKGAIKSFFSQLIDDLQSSEDMAKVKGLVIAGPGEAKNQLLDMLPPALKEKVLGSVDISMDSMPEDLIEIGYGFLQESGSNRKKLALEELKSAIFKGRPAACGLSEVKAAG